MSGSDIDRIIDEVAQEMLFKHPPGPQSPGAKFERGMRRVQRDYDVRDRSERATRGPLVIREEKEES